MCACGKMYVYFRLMVHPSLQFIYESFPIRSYFSLWDLIASVDTFWRVESNGLTFKENIVYNGE